MRQPMQTLVVAAQVVLSNIFLDIVEQLDLLQCFVRALRVGSLRFEYLSAGMRRPSASRRRRLVCCIVRSSVFNWGLLCR